MKIKWGKMETMTYFIFVGSKITVDGDSRHEIKNFAPWKESHDRLRYHTKKQKHQFADRGPYRQCYFFFSSPVCM